MILANETGRDRIHRSEILLHLVEAFADEDDPRVYDAVLERMRTTMPGQ
jgi:hypothetical protein